MQNITHISAATKVARSERRVYRSQPQWRAPRRNSCVQARITVSSHGDSFGVGVVIYRASQPTVRDFILLKPGQCLNAERAWLMGYQHICTWLDEHAPDAQLFIISADERTNRRRAA